MTTKKTFYPMSIAYIICCIILNLFLIGLLSLIIIGIKTTNFVYLIIGIIGFLFLIIEDVRLLSWRIILYDTFLIVKSSIFDKYFNKERFVDQKLYFSDIVNIKLITIPTQVIFISCRDKDKPIPLYIKQFSRKQSLKLIDEINLKINKH